MCRPADALLSSEPGGGQGNLATHSGRGLHVLSSFLCDARCFVFFFDMRFRLGTPPPRGTVGCATFLFRVGFRLLSRSPRRDDSLREGFDFGFPCLRACVLLQFAFIRLAPPPRRRCAGGL